MFYLLKLIFQQELQTSNIIEGYLSAGIEGAVNIG